MSWVIDRFLGCAHPKNSTTQGVDLSRITIRTICCFILKLKKIRSTSSGPNWLSLRWVRNKPWGNSPGEWIDGHPALKRFGWRDKTSQEGMTEETQKKDKTYSLYMFIYKVNFPWVSAEVFSLQILEKVCFVRAFIGA